jgi:hypothetical protein
MNIGEILRNRLGPYFTIQLIFAEFDQVVREIGWKPGVGSQFLLL